MTVCEIVNNYRDLEDSRISGISGISEIKKRINELKIELEGKLNSALSDYDGVDEIGVSEIRRVIDEMTCNLNSEKIIIN